MEREQVDGSAGTAATVAAPEFAAAEFPTGREIEPTREAGDAAAGSPRGTASEPEQRIAMLARFHPGA